MEELDRLVDCVDRLRKEHDGDEQWEGAELLDLVGDALDALLAEALPIAKISTLLDEGCEEIEGRIDSEPRMRAVRGVSKIREAQAILLGDPATRPEEN